MDTKHIKKVRYVHALDPVGRQIITVAAGLWSPGETLPDWRENEYLRGQAELIVDVVRIIIPGEGDVEIDDLRDRAVTFIQAAAYGALDAAFAVVFDPESDYCSRCDAVTKYDGEKCTVCGREWGYE